MSSPATRYAFCLSEWNIIQPAEVNRLIKTFIKLIYYGNVIHFMLTANWFVFRVAKLFRICDISIVNFYGDKDWLFYSKSLIWNHYFLAIFQLLSQFFWTQIISSTFFSFPHYSITNGSLMQSLLSIRFTTFINSSSCPIRDCVLERPILVRNKRCYVLAGAVALSFRTIKSICIQPRPRFNSTKRSNCSSNDEMNLTAGSTERFLRPRARSIELKRGRASRCAMKSDKSQWPCNTTSMKSSGFAKHNTSSIRFFTLWIHEIGDIKAKLTLFILQNLNKKKD